VGYLKFHLLPRCVAWPWRASIWWYDVFLPAVAIMRRYDVRHRRFRHLEEDAVGMPGLPVLNSAVDTGGPALFTAVASGYACAVVIEPASLDSVAGRSRSRVRAPTLMRCAPSDRARARGGPCSAARECAARLASPARRQAVVPAVASGGWGWAPPVCSSTALLPGCSPLPGRACTARLRGLPGGSRPARDQHARVLMPFTLAPASGIK
jgi:hypothetical protein